jgi:hypothetical protein
MGEGGNTGGNENDDELTTERFLRLVVAASKAIEPAEKAFGVSRIDSQPGARVQHPGFRSPDVVGRGEMRVPRQRIEDLADADLIRLRKETVRTGVASAGQPARTVTSERWDFDVLPAAALEVRRLDALAAPPGEAFDISWPAIDPVLQAVYVAYASSPAAGLGVSREAIDDALGRSHDDMRIGRALHELVRTGWLESRMQSDTRIGPSYVELTEKALRRVAGWPGDVSDSAASQLLDLIQERLDAATTPEERTKWERLRDASLGVGHDFLLELLKGLARSGAHHLPT